MDTYYAHIAADGRKQTVEEHLRGTAKRAATFADDFGAGAYGNLAGIAHDIGKYTPGFQKRLYGGPKVDHSSAGAVECARINAPLTGCCVVGHHGGLPDFGSPTDSENDITYIGRIKKALCNRTNESVAWNGVLPSVLPEPDFSQNRFAQSLWCRMLYSCLVDADFLDTEAFMQGTPTARGAHSTMHSLLERFLLYVKQWKNPSTELNRIRCDILKSCIEMGETKKGIFSLTVPTGGGKTVASLAFALHHAVRHHMKRVIYVIPYTSIIEQNAEVFRKILGTENVVEHHSEAETNETEDCSSSKASQALATENWDAPVIVTTAVQFFESLYSSKPSKCRKLHNIANSVIIFDEAQMIPAHHLRPCVAAIANLVAHFHASAVLCTATQPVLGDLFKEYAQALHIREICPNTNHLFSVLQRVVYRNAGMLSTDVLCDELATQSQVLCIVNTRKKAQEIYHKLPPDGSFHLSTLMYPKHRQEELAVIRKRLQSGAPCRVISTSLIEAGVDVDFPVVYRELSGLDSIVQAAGRCNREGKRSVSESAVTVFETDAAAPRLLKINIGAAREALASFDDPSSPQAIERYFSSYRSLIGNGIDKSGAVQYLTNGISGCLLPFRTVSENFRMIDSNTKTVYIPCTESQSLIDEIISGSASRYTYRAVGGYGVNIYEHHYRALLEAGDIIAIDDTHAYLANASLYDPNTGLSLQADNGKAEFI